MPRTNNYCIACRKNNVDDASTKVYKTFYSIPTSPRRRDAWVKSLKLQDTKITTQMRVCNLHFSRRQMVRMRLKKDAVPTLVNQQVLSKTGSLKPIRQPKSLGPLYLLTQVTPVPVLQLQSTSSTPLILASSAQGLESRSKQSFISSPVPPRPIPSSSTAGTSSSGKSTATTSSPENEGPDSIPPSLRQLLQNSLKKEVADKVLKDAPSARSFCHKILTEVESWIKSQKLVKSGQQEQVRVGIDQLRRMECGDEEEEEDLSIFLRPAKVEVTEDPLGNDNLSDSRAREFLKMEWHDESLDAEEEEQELPKIDAEKEVDTDEVDESVLGL